MIVVRNVQKCPPPSPVPPLIAYTTPEIYAGRLSRLIRLKGWTPLWCPTLTVQPTPQTISSIHHFLRLPDPLLRHFSAVAFTSRTGITAFTQALSDADTPPLSPDGEIFTVSALGKDSELLNQSFLLKLCRDPARIRILIPPMATPTGMVEALGLGEGRKILCPVPAVVELEEPPVVPKFLSDLRRNGWEAERLEAYETRWWRSGVAKLVGMMEGEHCGVDAIVFTSTAEVEGMLKSLKKMGLDWWKVRQMCPRMVAAAHGPVTAAGAEKLGVGIDVVGSKFDSFQGILDALSTRLDLRF